MTETTASRGQSNRRRDGISIKRHRAGRELHCHCLERLDQLRTESAVHGLRDPGGGLRGVRQWPRYHSVQQGEEASSTHQLLHHLAGHRRSVGRTLRHSFRDPG